MLAFMIGTFFGLILGMVLNHAIEESERKRAEAERLRRVINQLQGGNEDGKYN
jgi:hypothetical protein